MSEDISNVIHVPPTFTKAEADALKAENAGSVFLSVQPLKPGESIITEAHPSFWSGVLSWLKPLVDAGLTIFVPGPLGAFVEAAVNTGIDNVKAVIDKAPVTERWTIARLQEEAASIQEPQT